MRVNRDHRILDRTFFVSLILKGLNGLVELIAGGALLILSPSDIDRLAHRLTQHRLAVDPDDFIANWLVHYTAHLDVGTTVFGAVYLLVHGIVKVFLVIAVLRDKLWAYPWLIGFLTVFIGYQTVELFLHFSWFLLGLTAFDIFIVVLTVREYRLHRRRRAERITTAT
ncbi:DUF2127 domain-containing protein [Microbacterium gorillae]|uniref:DUF2127 domain-containing protein n=1 Tax=Microbacterium gorillae TaxID=1231063 RepID=UPI00058FB8A5|nr:DUF2127 domain-containing protein [Microbacterium gorillae]